MVREDVKTAEPLHEARSLDRSLSGSDEEDSEEDEDVVIKMVGVHKTYLLGLEGV